MPLRTLFDPFIATLLLAILIATLLPCRGEAAHAFAVATDLAIGLLFFLHGARLSRQAVIGGLAHWRLHALVLAATFVLFPLLGLGMRALPAWAIRPELATGILFLCLLPSTVQSSIAFTSIAGGNVAASICSATASNLLGMAVTPILAGIFLSTVGGGPSLATAEGIVLQLLLPFIAGQLARPLIGAWAARNRKLLTFTDRGSITLVVYTAFSAAVIGGLWHRVSGLDLVKLALLDGALLALVLGITRLASRSLGFNREDEIVIVFCGSKKSLATGVPMAGILFPAHAVGMIVLPLMLFHQIQLMVCAVLAKRYAVAKVSASD